MSDMVERVARAMQKTMPGREASPVPFTPLMLVLARAAIEAMREPGKAALDAGFHKADEIGFLSDNEDVSAVYLAVITEALRVRS